MYRFVWGGNLGLGFFPFSDMETRALSYLPPRAESWINYHRLREGMSSTSRFCSKKLPFILKSILKSSGCPSGSRDICVPRSLETLCDQSGWCVHFPWRSLLTTHPASVTGQGLCPPLLPVPDKRAPAFSWVLVQCLDKGDLWGSIMGSPAFADLYQPAEPAEAQRPVISLTESKCIPKACHPAPGLLFSKTHSDC